jgi:hypothetical protein
MIMQIYIERLGLVLNNNILANFFKFRRTCLTEGRKRQPTSLSTS